MEKTIFMRMTAKRAEETGAPMRPGYGTAMRPVTLNLETMTPPAAWIAQHITATYVVDELRDRIGIAAVAGFSMMQRDMNDWRYEHSADFRAMVESRKNAYGADYTDAPMRIDEITFPIYDSQFSRPEDVIERAARELESVGSIRLESRDGDAYVFEEARNG